MNRNHRMAIGAGIMAGAVWVWATAVCPAAEKPAAEMELRKQKQIVAFTGTWHEPEKMGLKNANLLALEDDSGWKAWQGQGVIVGKLFTTHQFHVWKSAEEGANTVAYADFYGRTNPVAVIDCVNMDLGGPADCKMATIIKRAKTNNAGLAIVAVHQAWSPIHPVLARAYHDAADLVIVEGDAGGGTNQYWRLAAMIKSIELAGLANKAVVELALGQAGVVKKQELEQQARFVCYLAPGLKGISFLASPSYLNSTNVEQGLVAYADELGGRYASLPADGKDLPEEVKKIAEPFRKAYPLPCLVVSPVWVREERQADNPYEYVNPFTYRVVVMNLGMAAAENVRVQLWNPKITRYKVLGGDMFAEGLINRIPGRSVTTVRLQTLPYKETTSYRKWDLKVLCENAEVLEFK